jgi:hypothetical protein
MTTQTIFAKNKHVFCAFHGNCEFKKTTSNKKMLEPNARRATCLWNGNCNQQIDQMKQNLIRSELIKNVKLVRSSLGIHSR